MIATMNTPLIPRRPSSLPPPSRPTPATTNEPTIGEIEARRDELVADAIAQALVTAAYDLGWPLKALVSLCLTKPALVVRGIARAPRMLEGARPLAHRR